MRSFTGLVLIGLVAAACNGGSATSDQPEKAPGDTLGKGESGSAAPVTPKANAPAPATTASAAATPTTTAGTAAAPAGGATEYQANGYPKVMPKGRSARPTAAEWSKAPLVTTKKMPKGCTIKFVREWLQFACLDVPGAAMPTRVEEPGALFGKPSGAFVSDPDVNHEEVFNERVELVARTMPEELRRDAAARKMGINPDMLTGSPATTRFVMDDGKVYYTVGYHWPTGAPFPSVLFIPTTQKGAGDSDVFFECKAGAECGAGLRCCGSASGSMGTSCRSMCDWSQQSQTCATDADCTNVPPGGQAFGIKLSWTKCVMSKGAPANSPKFCQDPKDN
jgi:hypothetical protein